MSRPVTILIQLNLAEEWPATARIQPSLERAALAAVATAEPAVEGEIGVSFVSEDVILELNRRYLGRSASTDVIAFQLGEAEEILGDIYIAPDVAARSAAELGIPEEEELIRLLVHGVLHVLGHDHPEGEERYGSPMFRLQEQLVDRLTGAES